MLNDGGQTCLLQKLPAGIMHLLKSKALLTSFGDIALYLIAGESLALGTELHVLLLAAFSYLTVLAELVAVGGNCAAAAAGDVLGVKYPLSVGIFMSEKSAHSVIVTLGGDKDGTFIAHYSAAGNCFHFYIHSFQYHK